MDCWRAAGAARKPGGELHRAGRTGFARPRCAGGDHRAEVATAVLAQDFSPLCRRTCCRRRPRNGTAFAPLWNRLRRWLKAGISSCATCIFWTRADQTATADTQFFCSNATGSLTVTINMTALPPGRYAVALADAAGAPLAGQMGVVLAWDGAATAWKLAGLTVRPGCSTGMMAYGTGCARGSWPRLILGAHGIAMTRRATCCCPSIFYPRRICKNCTRSSR